MDFFQITCSKVSKCMAVEKSLIITISLHKNNVLHTFYVHAHKHAHTKHTKTMHTGGNVFCIWYFPGFMSHFFSGRVK